MIREVHPQVARRGARADGHPEELCIGDPPPLDGHGEEAVQQPGVTVAALAASLVDTRAPGGAQLVPFEGGGKGLRPAPISRARGVSPGDETADGVLDDYGAF